MYAILRMAPYDYCTHLLLQVHVGVIVLKFRCRILTHAKPRAKALLRFLNLKRRIGLVNNMAEAESFGPRATQISTERYDISQNGAFKKLYDCASAE